MSSSVGNVPLHSQLHGPCVALPGFSRLVILVAEISGTFQKASLYSGAVCTCMSCIALKHAESWLLRPRLSLSRITVFETARFSESLAIFQCIVSSPLLLCCVS